MIKTVTCVNADGRKNLTLGEDYDVVALQADGDYVVTDDSGKNVKVAKSRFEDIDDESNDIVDDFDSDEYTNETSVPVANRVTCINADGRKYLTVGDTYPLVGLQPDGDYIVIDSRGKEVKVAKSRFVETVSANIPEVTFDELEATSPATVDTDKVSTTMYADDEFSFQFTGTITTWKAFVSTLK